jgi:hypothetical protein
MGNIHRGGIGAHYMRGTGDFVKGSFTVPQNPVVTSGMGDFVKGNFTVPQNPVRTGMSGVGCGPSCGCGPCSGGDGGYYGMGAVDYSLTGTGIGTATGMTALASIPNWAFYVGALGLLYVFFPGHLPGDRRPKRR